MMEQEIRIVKCTPEYYERIGEIAVQAWQNIYEGYRAQLGDELFEGFFSKREERKRKGVIAEAETGNCYIALAGDTVAGFANFRIEGEIGEICSNGVAPEFRGNHIGTRLQAFILDRMKEAGCRFAFVHTGLDDGHAPARAAYHKNGFEAGLPSVTYYKKL